MFSRRLPSPPDLPIRLTLMEATSKVRRRLGDLPERRPARGSDEILQMGAHVARFLRRADLTLPGLEISMMRGHL